MNFFEQIGIASFLTLLTIAVHSGCTLAVLKVIFAMRPGDWVMRSYARMVAVIAAVVIVLLAASIVEAALWAVAYLLLGALEGIEPALYFSLVTYTTLGYGDITLDDSWRLLGSLQAANGIVVFGWTTAIVIAVVQRVAGREKPPAS